MKVGISFFDNKKFPNTQTTTKRDMNVIIHK